MVNIVPIIHMGGGKGEGQNKFPIFSLFPVFLLYFSQKYLFVLYIFLYLKGEGHLKAFLPFSCISLS